jgi:methyl-accepting chemotaxis protein
LPSLKNSAERAKASNRPKGLLSATVFSCGSGLTAADKLATDEIGSQIAHMQSATEESVGAIKQINGTINRISEITGLIAAAVEEQGAVTAAIANNIQQAAKGTSDVASNINEVSQSAAETGSASEQVLSSARSLANENTRLKMEVQKFLITVRAA